MKRFDIIAFDADDTLWENEVNYRRTEQIFKDLLTPYHAPAWIEERLFQTEMRNMQHFGYGIKPFGLSMIETAIELTEGRVTGAEIQVILDAIKRMLTAPIELLPHVAEVIPLLAGQVPLMLITKGDLLDQERKLAQSGLGDLFHAVEIVSDKTPAVYARIFARHGDGAGHAMMVGNSLKSDILPALQAGAWAVHVPHDLTWVLEHAEEPTGTARYRAIDDLRALLSIVQEIG